MGGGGFAELEELSGSSLGDAEEDVGVVVDVGGLEDFSGSFREAEAGAIGLVVDVDVDDGGLRICNSASSAMLSSDVGALDVLAPLALVENCGE